MQKNMSLILSDNSAPPNTAHTAKTSQIEGQLRNPPSLTVQLFLPQAHLVEPFFTEGTSTTVARSYKRIKRALDSSDEDSPPAIPFQ